MSAAALSKLESAVAPAATREAVLRRYRQLRAASRELRREIEKLVPPAAVPQTAARLGLVQGQTVVVDQIDDLAFIFDLLVYTAPPGRTRAIDRYARSARLAPDSDEAHMLTTMRQARFSVVEVKHRHPVAGLIVEDLMRNEEVWLVDEGMEASMEPGFVLATRFYSPEDFAMTAGLTMPCSIEMLEMVADEAPHLLRKPKHEIPDDRRFAEAIYRLGFATGMSRRRTGREPTSPDGASAD